ncbi:MAG: ATPase, T2SS/T4P/T4SS family [Candidatus Thermoplasmatota archaeon]|mgnify:CR=1 FL=1
MDPDDAAEERPGLAARLREAGNADDAAVARARAHKAGLAERMRAMVADGGVEPVAAVADLGTTTSRADVAPVEPEVATFAQRLRGGKAAPAALFERAAQAPARNESPSDSARAPAGVPRAQPPPARVQPAATTRMVRWFLGREEQTAGEGPVTPIPPLEAGWEQVDFYDLDPPFSFVRIVRQSDNGQLRYEAIEPVLSEREQRTFEFVQDALVRGLNIDPGPMKPEQREGYLLGAVRQILKDYRIRLDTREQLRVEYYLRRDFLGLGTIHSVMVDPRIEDISCDGAAEPLFIFHREHESIPSNIRFRSDGELDAFVIRLAQRSGKAISISDPILDAALPDGSRLQATLGREVTQNGSTFTIRRFKPDPFTPLDLVRFGTMSIDMLTWFWLTVEAGQSLIFSGGTASGKTTGLNAIAQFIPPQAKVVSIEDTREVNLPHHNWIKAVTRSGSTSEGTGEIGMFDLLKASLRQRPEYILVGEVRGIEATVAFQAMATGHTVYSTMHADSARSVVYRLENDPINVPRLVLQALDIIAIQAQVRYKGKRVRRVKEIVELVGMDPSTKEILTNTVFKWDAANDTFEMGARSYLIDDIASDRNWSKARMAEEQANRRRVLQWMIDQGYRDVREITAVVQAYYRDPASVLQRIAASPAAPGAKA